MKVYTVQVEMCRTCPCAYRFSASGSLICDAKVKNKRLITQDEELTIPDWCPLPDAKEGEK